MSTYSLLIFLSVMIIFSYFFDVFARRTRIPSVLLLLLSGMGIRELLEYNKIESISFLNILPALGTIGLILIVFEGALELHYNKSKNKVIRESFMAALSILLSTNFVVAYFFHLFTNHSFYLCFLNAIPFCVISSAIAIPSVASLRAQKREFIIYESSFSDIIGIVLFNFVLNNSEFTPGAFAHLGLDILLVMLVSASFCLLLLYILGRIQHHVKFFLVIAILILVYAVGKQFHLPTLITVLAFGLFLANADQIRYPIFLHFFMYKRFLQDFHQLLQISAESAFLIRTFFFVIFGFSMEISQLQNQIVFEFGIWLLIITYVLRYLGLKFLRKGESVLPELFITPRGLISILLYFSLPDELKLPGLETGLLFLIILSTSIIMTFGLVWTKQAPEEGFG